MMKKLITAAMIAVLLITLAACSGGSKQAAPAKEVKLADIAAGFGLDSEMMALSESDMLDMYGIEAADMKQFYAAVNSSGIKADEVVLVEAANADAAKRVKEALDKRYNNKLNEMENYIPEEFAVIKACKVEQSGNFVSMIVSGNAADLVKAYNEAIK